ncbi:MAG: 4a-hydroxytetrahydrobiopterin dehydratase [Nocardioidaceae bacterium]|nr:4a-hydroxytetrahydrobiopterin dehydratase [Nocardioidaceae bacterium]
MAGILTDEQITAALSDLNDWTREDAALVRSVEASTFADGIRLVADVAAVADERDHHPDIDIRYTTVTFRLSTHSEGGITDNDVQLARAIDRLAG